MVRRFQGYYTQCNAEDYRAVIGCDEVGRGALCGPVVVAAVWFDPAKLPRELFNRLDDSKLISKKQRMSVCRDLKQHVKYALAASSNRVIDRINIRCATLDAMRRAVRALNISAQVVVDGVDAIPGIDLECIALPKAERRSPQVAAASIVAKCTRDEIMERLSTRYAHYYWHKNVGYATRTHQDAIRVYGRTKHHRESFRLKSDLLYEFDQEHSLTLEELST